MPFIGTQPEVGGYSVLDALTASATASYTLQKNSVNFNPSSANNLLVSLNGVIQKPGSSFTVSGSTLTFSSALESSDSIDFIIAMGEPLLIGTPSDATVTGSKLASNIGISTTGNIATTGSGTLSVAGTAAITGNTTVGGTLVNTGLITASAGVAVGGTGAANTLDDYEIGTWAPTLKNEGDNSLSAGYVSAYTHGRYTKIGEVVMFQMTVNLNSISGGSSSQHLICNNMPFVCKTYETNSNGGCLVNYSSNVGTDMYLGLMLGNSANLRFYKDHNGNTFKTNGLQSNTWFQCYGQYETPS